MIWRTEERFRYLCRHQILIFLIIQHADDTLLIMPAEESQIRELKLLLQKKSTTTGLKINFDKSWVIPFNVEASMLSSLALNVKCQHGSSRFTYLGLPVGTVRPKIQDLTPIVTRMERRLCATSCFLSQGVRLHLINSALHHYQFTFLVLCTFLKA